MRRVSALTAIAIVLMLGTGAAAWMMRVHALASEVSAQADLARTLIDAGAAPDRRFVRTIVRDDLHVIVANFETGRVIDAFGSDLREHPLPPAMPGPGGPEGPGGPGRRARPPRSPFVGFALQLAHIAPIAIRREGAVITVAPGGPALLRFLAIDALLVLLVSTLAISFAVRYAARQRRSERAALLANLEERRAAAERYQRFLAETGHELRTPLTIVSGYVDILRKSDVLAGFDRRVIEGMYAETTRMRALVEKMLTLARLNSPVSVPRLLDAADAAAEITATAQRRFPEREIAHIRERSASIVIDGDDLTEALGNLIENAVKYAPNSPIAVRCTTDGGGVAIAVSDGGPGIPAEERDAIFERFYRARDRSGAEGLGLGLAIVKRVVDRWNGTIDLESRPGRTVFTLRFPVADEESHADSR